MDYNNYSDFNSEKEKCRDCCIGKIYDKVVLGDGCINPIVLVLGEAPGSDEVLQGKPFVGKAGKLLRESLNKFGYNKSNTLISNTIPCRPENNKFPSDNKLVMDCVKKWLYNEIKLTNPKAILLIGATPTKFILGKSGITKIRGNWFDFELDGKIYKCMPSLHPSYVLRKQYMQEGEEIKRNFLQDLESVAIIYLKEK